MLTPKRFMVLSAGVLCVGLVHNSSFAQNTPVLSDGQIAEALITIDEGEVKASKMAEHKTQNSDVKGLADMMVKDHTKNRDETKSLAHQLSIDLKESDLTKTLADEEKTNKTELKGTKDFDKVYANMMVTGHQEALDTLDKTLIPQAQNPTLREHLNKTRKAVAMHLDHAKELAAKFQ